MKPNGFWNDKIWLDLLTPKRKDVYLLEFNDKSEQNQKKKIFLSQKACFANKKIKNDGIYLD